jgi:hypothetical protein
MTLTRNSPLSLVSVGFNTLYRRTETSSDFLYQLIHPVELGYYTLNNHLSNTRFVSASSPEAYIRRSDKSCAVRTPQPGFWKVTAIADSQTTL